MTLPSLPSLPARGAQGFSPGTSRSRPASPGLPMATAGWGTCDFCREAGTSLLCFSRPRSHWTPLPRQLGRRGWQLAAVVLLGAADSETRAGIWMHQVLGKADGPLSAVPSSVRGWLASPAPLSTDVGRVWTQWWLPLHGLLAPCRGEGPTSLVLRAAGPLAWIQSS